MKKIAILCVAILLSLTALSQEYKKFSPEKFQADMEGYIAREAALTPQEAAKLFPIFREMHAKMRAIHGKILQLSKEKPADQEACAALIKQYDKMNVELKQVECNYHKKMMQQVPASKVYDVIKAESRFHRKMMKGWQKGRR